MNRDSNNPDTSAGPTEPYLWDCSGAPDPVIRRLEETLVSQRLVAREPTPGRAVVPVRRALAAAAVLALAAATAFVALRPRPSWEVVTLDGAPTVDSDALPEKGRLARNDWLETDASSRASLTVADIGSVTVEPGSRVRLVESAAKHHRLELAKGTIEAFITAPPRLFFVDTPSAQAIDMGCIYTLSVADDGSSTLHTTFGLVEMVRTVGGREIVSRVPSDALCRTDMQRGPGTPRFDDAPEELARALDAFDQRPADKASLEAVIAHARERDTLSLWHLLSRSGAPERGAVLERLIALAGRPDDTTDQETLRATSEALEAWWDHLRVTW